MKSSDDNYPTASEETEHGLPGQHFLMERRTPVPFLEDAGTSVRAPVGFLHGIYWYSTQNILADLSVSVSVVIVLTTLTVFSRSGGTRHVHRDPRVVPKFYTARITQKTCYLPCVVLGAPLRFLARSSTLLV